MYSGTSDKDHLPTKGTLLDTFAIAVHFNLEKRTISAKDKTAGPKVSFLWRFTSCDQEVHCAATVYFKLVVSECIVQLYCVLCVLGLVVSECMLCS